MKVPIKNIVPEFGIQHIVPDGRLNDIDCIKKEHFYE